MSSSFPPPSSPPPPPPPTPPPTPPPGPSVAVQVCYRHPDRPTRLSCSSCGKAICVDCSNPAPVGQKCPDCANPGGRSKVITARQIRERPATSGAPVTMILLVVTIGIAVLELVAKPTWRELFGLLSDDIGAVAGGEWWRTVTAALLHDPGSPLHAMFNMWALYVLGPQLERRVGSPAFALFYVAAAAAGGLAYQLTNDVGTAIGASGAIFGLLGAYTITAYLARHTAAGRAGLNQFLPILGINLALPFFINGIAWQAHVGGLVAGVAIMYAWSRLKVDKRWLPAVPAVVLVAVVLTLMVL